MIGMLTALVCAQVLPINDATIGFSSKSVLAVMAVRSSCFGPALTHAANTALAADAASCY